MRGFTLAMNMQFPITECLNFGALISATDLVTVISILSDLGVQTDLYALIFGESALNDAVALVLAQYVLLIFPLK